MHWYNLFSTFACMSIKYSVIYSDKHVVIETKQENTPVYKFMYLVMIFSICLPLLVLLFFITNGYPLQLGMFLLFGVFGLTAYYFYRLATWNKFGKEHFFIQNKSFIYMPEAKGISFSKVVFSIDGVVASQNETSTDQNCTLKLEESDLKLSTKIKLSPSDAQQIILEFEKWKSIEKQ